MIRPGGRCRGAQGHSCHPARLRVASTSWLKRVVHGVGLLAARGGFDHVFASMGPWWQNGPIVEQSGEEYRAVMRASLDRHMFAAQALLPPIRGRAGASYTIVTGQGGHMTIPGTGLLVVAVNDVFGLSRMLRSEHAADPVRVNESLSRRPARTAWSFSTACSRASSPHHCRRTAIADGSPQRIRGGRTDLGHCVTAAFQINKSGWIPRRARRAPR